MQAIPLFGIGNQGKSPNVDAQSRVNLYIEIQPDAQKHVLTMYPTPGLATFINFGVTPVRGLYERMEGLYAVHKDKFYSISNDGIATERGTLGTFSGRVGIADNGTQIMIVDGPNGYIYNTASLVFAKITDADFPGADTVDFLNGRFIVNKPNSGQFHLSKAYDGLVWDALDFATAESNPDNLVRVMVDAGTLWLYGDKTVEPWSDSGAADFPLARIGSAAIEWGLASRWSLAKFMDGTIFLRRNRLGQVQVAIQSGGQSVAVSTLEIDHLFSQYVTVADATGFSYMLSGHPMYQINFPTAGVSWLYDGQSKAWSSLQSGAGRHRAETHTQLLNKAYVSDYETGKIYRLRDDVFTDDGMPIVREFTSRHQAAGDYSTFSALWLEMEAGVGLQLGQGSDPQIMMQISRDGGKTWGAEIWRSFGKVGETRARAVWNRLGRARDWVYRFRITDPVKTVFIAAWGRRS